MSARSWQANFLIRGSLPTNHIRCLIFQIQILLNRLGIVAAIAHKDTFFSGAKVMLLARVWAYQERLLSLSLSETLTFILASSYRATRLRTCVNAAIIDQQVPQSQRVRQFTKSDLALSNKETVFDLWHGIISQYFRLLLPLVTRTCGMLLVFSKIIKSISNFIGKSDLTFHVE